MASGHHLVIRAAIRPRMAEAVLKSLFIWQLRAGIRLRGCDITNIGVGYFSRSAKNRIFGMHYFGHS